MSKRNAAIALAVAIIAWTVVGAVITPILLVVSSEPLTATTITEGVITWWLVTGSFGIMAICAILAFGGLLVGVDELL